jgi:DNA polymerase-3 subunit delta
MKIDPRGIDRFLNDPGPCSVILLYGPDAGLVSERARALTKRIAGTLDDPFLIAELNADQAGRIMEEVTAQALGGGRRVVRVRDASDAMLTHVQAALDAKAESVLILQAGDLPGKSKLRALADRAAQAGSIGCYPPEGAKLSSLIEDQLSALKISISHEALTWCQSRLSSDSGAVRQAIEKLLLYAGEGGKLTLADVIEAMDDQASASVGEAIDAALTGDLAGLDRAITLALAEGGAPIGILRILMAELRRLLLLVSQIADGVAARDALAAARPPVFFRRVNIVTKQTQLWSVASLREALAAALRAEMQCKQTNAPDEEIIRQLLTNFARRARR